MNDIRKYPRITVVFCDAGDVSDTVLAWLEQGAAVESKRTNTGWMHRLVEGGAR